MTSRSTKRTLRVYRVSAAALVAVMGAVTWLTYEGAREHALADADVEYQKDVRNALLRMESRVGSMLALQIGATERSADPVHSNWLQIGTNTLGAEVDLASAVKEQATEAADEAFLLACSNVRPTPERPEIEGRPSSWIAEDFNHRSLNTQQIAAFPRSGTSRGVQTPWTIGPTAPLWCEGTPEMPPSIILARRIETPDGVSHRADVLPWEDVRTTLLAEIDELFPAARLEPMEDRSPRNDVLRLAALPVRLVLDADAERAARMDPGGHGSLFVALIAAWTALLGALGFGWFALRTSIAYGDKHRRFTHAVTHELRTPLTTFRMYSEMLSRGMVPEDARAEYLSTLERESTRLSGLVENVLRYARLEEGPAEAELETIDLGALVERLAPELRTLAHRHGATLDSSDSSSSGARVATDVDAAEQILSNLVENAGKYGRDDERANGAPTIRLETGVLNGDAYIDVVDSGNGIDPANRDVIFEPFERAGLTSADPHPGVGLGLALSRDLARALGGDLVLAPRGNGDGARFRFVLPGR